MTPEEWLEQRKTWPKPSQAAGQWIRAKALELAVESCRARYVPESSIFDQAEAFRQYIETGQVSSS